MKMIRQHGVYAVTDAQKNVYLTQSLERALLAVCK